MNNPAATPPAATPPAITDFQEAFNRVELHIEKHYGIPVSISDVLDPNTGDFDGSCIKVDYDRIWRSPCSCSSTCSVTPCTVSGRLARR